MSQSNARARSGKPILDKKRNVSRIPARTRADKRTQRTRLKLQKSLHELLKTEDYEVITVEAICEHGAIGRSTFYTHFRGKDDLKRSAIDHLHAELLSAQRRTASGPPFAFAFARALFDHAKQHLRDYQALSRGRGARIVLSRIKQILTQLVREDLLRHRASQFTIRDDRLIDMEVVYIVGALMAMLTQWLAEGAHGDVETVTQLFADMSQRALARNDE